MSGNGLYPSLAEVESRRNAYYRSIFDKYDRDHDGYLNVAELGALVESREYENDIPQHVIRRVHALADTNRDGRLDFAEFVDMLNHPRLRPLFGHYVSRYVNLVVPRRPAAGRSVTDGVYEEEYSCYPPAVGMLLISLVEIVFFSVDEALAADRARPASGPLARALIFDPGRRGEAWRFLTYMFVHAGAFHLFVNLLVQILIGVPLEMVHRWWRVLGVYAAGVVAGSLITSLVDPQTRLVGASGGVYALIAAHVATIIMNWKEMTYPLVQLFIFIIVIGTDLGTVIYNRYVMSKEDNIAYMAHFAGAIAGLLVGLNILRNLDETYAEKVIWWVSIILFAGLMLLAVVLNFVWTEHWDMPRMNIN